MCTYSATGGGIGSFKGEVESFEDRTDVVISRMYE